MKKSNTNHLIVFEERNKLFTTSDVIAQQADVSYRSVQRLIEMHENDLLEFGQVRFEITPVKYNRGTNDKKIYHLNELQATLLITYLKNTLPVRTFKKELVKQFYEMRQMLQERKSTKWNELRNDGKESQKEFSLAVKEYVNYCTANGSRNAGRYYGNFNSMINSAVGCKHRDTADSIQLAQLSVYDLILSQIIRSNISSGTEYHEIFKLCKDFVLSNRTSLEMGRRTS